MPRPQIYSSDMRRWIVIAFAVIAGFAAIGSIWGAVQWDESCSYHRIIVFIWTLGPPLWFVIEYFFVFDNWNDAKAVEEFKYVAGLTAKCWAALLVLLTAIYSSKGMFSM